MEHGLLKTRCLNYVKSTMSRLVLIASLLALVFSTRAADKLGTLVAGDITYTNVTITATTATDVFFKHDGGLANARLRQLSPELQKKFNYDPEASAQIEAEQSIRSSTFGEVLAETDLNERERRRIADAGPPVEAELLDTLPGAESFLGKSAPSFKPDAWATEKPETEGKFQLFYFWATDSTASRRPITQLNELAKLFRDKLVVIGVSKEPVDTLEELKLPKLEFSSASDKKGGFAKNLGVTTIPCAVLIDTRGIVRYIGHPAAIDDASLKGLFIKFADKE